MSSESVRRQTIVTLVPSELKNRKEMRDGILMLTAHNLSFVQQPHKIAQAIPCVVVVFLAIGFFIRAAAGTLPISNPSLLSFSWAAAIGMLLYCLNRLYQIFTASSEAFRLDIPLISIAQLSEEQLRFTSKRHVLHVKTYSGKSHRFTIASDIAEWVNAIGAALKESYERSLQFRRDGDFSTWQVKEQ
jgi:hypothetical protein